MAIDAEFGREDGTVTDELQHDGRAQRRRGFAGFSRPASEEGCASVGRTRRDGDAFRDAERDGRLRGDVSDGRADWHDFREESGRESQFAEPIRPAATDWIVTGLQRVILIGLPVRGAEAAVDPVGLVDDAVQSRQLGPLEGTSRWRSGAMGGAFARGERLDLRGEISRVGVIIHTGRGERAVMIVDRQDRPRSRVDRDGAGGGEVELQAEFVEGRATTVPPIFRGLLAAGSCGLGCR